METLISGNKVPLYHQIAQTLKQRVRTGHYHTGSSLPSLRTLGEEFKVSPSVIYRAVRDLEENGIVKTHHGKGMMVLDGKSCEQAAILFGFIQPYSSSFAFESQVFHYAGQVFNNRQNFLITRSSDGNAEQERNVAMHFLNNGVKGLLFWPIEKDPNVQFFNDLAHKIPVVVVDRLLEKSDLPAVIHDTYDCGRSICHHMLVASGKRRMLALIDNLNISPYQDLIKGLHDEAVALGRMSDLSIVQLPISEFIGKLSTSFFSEIKPYQEYIERLLKEGEYDALFCPQGEFIDYVYIETGLYAKFPGVATGIMSGVAPDPNLTKLQELGVMQWVIDHPTMISQAANLLQEWVLTRERPRNGITMKVQLKQEKV